MEKLIVVIFDNEVKALEGSRLLWKLDSEGEISVYALRVVAKDASGPLRVIDDAEVASLPMVAGGTLVGALIGLLGGPAGAVIGAAAGLMVGTTGSIVEEAEEAGVTDKFVDDITAALTPGKVAVIADISEEWMAPVDTQMEQIGGTVFRRARSLVKAIEDDRDEAAHRAEIEQLKAERAQARADRLAKIDARIDNLRANLEAAVERKRVKMQLRQPQRDARFEALQTKANRANGDVRRRHEARIAELRRDYAEKAAAG